MVRGVAATVENWSAAARTGVGHTWVCRDAVSVLTEEVAASPE
jgi:hypothetical protein